MYGIYRQIEPFKAIREVCVGCEGEETFKGVSVGSFACGNFMLGKTDITKAASAEHKQGKSEQECCNFGKKARGTLIYFFHLSSSYKKCRPVIHIRKTGRHLISC